MRTALYPGSFNPWHDGHTDVLRKACRIFDIVLICQMENPMKQKSAPLDKTKIQGFGTKNFDVVYHSGLMVDAVDEHHCDAVIRGLRNGNDLEYEANLMYWNQELGLKVPVVCFITEQHLSHISSSALRALGEHKSRLKQRYMLL